MVKAFDTFGGMPGHSRVFGAEARRRRLRAKSKLMRRCPRAADIKETERWNVVITD
jgi:hypothetical protein